MLFPTHLAAAYLVGERWAYPSVPVVLGAALPDVVDKPLAMAGVVDLYHSVGHSLLALLGLAVAVRLSGPSAAVRVPGSSAAARVGRTGLALWVGWASHLALDAGHMVLNGRPGDVRFLAWPFVRHRPAVHLPPVEFLGHYLGTPASVVEVGIWAGVAYVAVTDRVRADDGAA